MEGTACHQLTALSKSGQRPRETSPLNQIFGGSLVSRVQCGRCRSVSSTKQPFRELVLEIERSDTVDEALAGYFASERIDGYGCEKCRAGVTATKQFALETPPKVLCLQLNRFSYFSNGKITKHVNFRRRLDLTRYTSGERVPLTYKLASIISHHGSSDGRGHYTAVAQSPAGGFYTFDDASVREMPHREVDRTSAYVLFYEHVADQPSYEHRKPNDDVKNVKSNIPAASHHPASPPPPVGYTQGWKPATQKTKKKHRRKRNGADA